MLDSAEGLIALALGLCALVGYIARTWVKRGSPLVKRMRAGLDTLVGREEQRDSITNELLAPALPGIGVRMASTEVAVELLTVTVTKLVDQQVYQQKLQDQVDDHETRIVKLEAAPTITASPQLTVQVGDRQ